MSRALGYLSAGAEIDGDHRFHLWREWQPAGKRVAFIMLNPSTADGAQDDPTIRRCVGFAKAWGYGALDVVNLFALRATDPAELGRHPDPIGPGNDTAISRVAKAAHQVVCAWGTGGGYLGRGTVVIKFLSIDLELWHLGQTKHGHPKHPLYLASTTQPQQWALLRWNLGAPKPGVLP